MKKTNFKTKNIILFTLLLASTSLQTSSNKVFITEDLFPWEEDIFGYDQDDPISEDEIFNDKKKYVIPPLTPLTKGLRLPMR